MKTEPRHHIPDDELQDVLEQELAQRVKSLRRRLSSYSSSYTIENLDVTLTHGKRLRLILKDLSPPSQLPTARQIRPRFLYNPAREIEVYQSILNPAQLGTAHCHGAVNLPEQKRHWLFLEHVAGQLLWQTGSLEAWDAAARWLATLHDRFLSNKPGRAKTILHCDEKFFAVWITRAEKFLRQQAFQSAGTQRQFDRLAGNYHRVVRRLVKLPVTFIHGEFYPSNVIVRKRKHAPICAIDWELAAIGPGVLDLAALTSGDWSDVEKRRFVSAYRETAGAPAALSVADLLEAVELCQLHLSVQMLGWAADWSPPEPHAQNWLRTALRLAGKLGL